MQKTKVELKPAIAEAMASYKAYDLPSVCERYGLAPGETEEAMRSKRSYVLSRLHGLTTDEVADLARKVAADLDDQRLAEELDRYNDAGQPTITDLTRRNIARSLEDVDIGGHVGLLTVLRGIFPIDQMPSESFAMDAYTLADDIYRHLVRNIDWSTEHLFEQIGALTCSQQRFFRLLEAIIDPAVRDEQEQRALAVKLNHALERDGYRLVKTSERSGYPVFTVLRATEIGPPADAPISEMLSSFDAEGVAAVWAKALDRRRSDPSGAITAARSLLETVAKHIIEARGGSYGTSDDLPKLYRAAAENLSLAPDQHTEKVFKEILGSCQSVVNSLGALRNRLGDSHGTGRRPAKPAPRHAELAVNLAGAMATFLVATHLSKPAGDL